MHPQPALPERIPDFFRKSQAHPLGTSRIIELPHPLGIGFGLAARH